MLKICLAALGTIPINKSSNISYPYIVKVLPLPV
jgi:hypothetical protein